MHHRQELEAKVVNSNASNERRGQYFGFILSAIALVGGLGLLFLGQSVVGFSVIVGDVGALAATTIYLRNKQQQERQRKVGPFPTQAPNPGSGGQNKKSKKHRR